MFVGLYFLKGLLCVRCVQLIDENFATGQIPITIDGTMLASGTYFVRIHSDENTQAVMRKITLLK